MSKVNLTKYYNLSNLFNDIDAEITKADRTIKYYIKTPKCLGMQITEDGVIIECEPSSPFIKEMDVRTMASIYTKFCESKDTDKSNTPNNTECYNSVSSYDKCNECTECSPECVRNCDCSIKCPNSCDTEYSDSYGCNVCEDCDFNGECRCGLRMHLQCILERECDTEYEKYSNNEDAMDSNHTISNHVDKYYCLGKGVEDCYCSSCVECYCENCDDYECTNCSKCACMLCKNSHYLDD